MSGVIRFGEATPIERGDGIQTVRLTPAPLPGQGFAIGVTSFPPGTGIALHTHNTVEQVTVLEGDALVVIGGGEQRLRPFDATQIAPGHPHRFVNVGDTVMRILWVYGAIQVTRTFVETGETVVQQVTGS